MLPSVRELLGGEVRMVDIREPDDVDLLGRPRIETDLAAASAYLSGRVVAVTGAGGFDRLGAVPPDLALRA